MEDRDVMNVVIKVWGQAVYRHIIDSLGKVRHFFQKEYNQVLGVYSEEGVIYIALLENRQGELQLCWQGKYVCTQEEDWRSAAAGAAMQVLPHLQGEVICYLVLTGQEVLYYDKEFPLLPEEELAQAAKWDFAAAASWNEEYVWDYTRLTDRVVRLGGIKRGDLAELVKPWQEFFHVGGGVLYCPDGEKASGEAGAIYGAKVGVEREGIVLSLVERHILAWQWLKLGAALWCCSLVLWLGLGLYYVWQYQGERDGLQRVRERLAIMDDLQSRQEDITRQAERLQGRYERLANLGEQGLPLEGLLTEVAVAMPEGVWLTEISGDRQQGSVVQLQGKAASYGQLSKLMEVWRQPDSYFKGQLRLKSTDTDEKGCIDFQVEGAL